MILPLQHQWCFQPDLSGWGCRWRLWSTRWWWWWSPWSTACWGWWGTVRHRGTCFQGRKKVCSYKDTAKLSIFLSACWNNLGINIFCRVLSLRLGHFQPRYWSLHLDSDIFSLRLGQVIETQTFWHERAAVQRSAFGRSTAGNDVVATIIISLFSYNPPEQHITPLNIHITLLNSI